MAAAAEAATAAREEPATQRRHIACTTTAPRSTGGTAAERLGAKSCCMACWAAARTCPTLLRCDPGPAMVPATRYNCLDGLSGRHWRCGKPSWPGRPDWLWSRRRKG